MAFEHSGPWKGALRAGATPASPTPSYQTANSTAASSSPGALSSHCVPSSPSTVGATTPTPSPHWAASTTALGRPSPCVSPRSPPVPHDTTGASPYSYSSAGGAYDADCDDDDDTMWETRSPAAHLRSLHLLEEAVAGPGMAAINTATKREKSAQLQALHLFDQEYTAPARGQDVLSDDDDGPPHDKPRRRPNADDLALPRLGSRGADYHGGGDDTSAVAHESVADCKSDLDVIRQRGANLRALSLLHVTAAGERYQILPDEGRGNSAAGPVLKVNDGGLSARRAAIVAYELRKQEKARVKAQLQQDLNTYGRPVPKLVVAVRKETLAESTRKKKPPTPDDVKDPETVSGMKCRLHWDREKEAQSKALKLLNEGYMI